MVTTYPAAPVPPLVPLRKPRLWPGFTILGVGVGLGILGFVLFGLSIASGLLNLPQYQAPVTVGINCQIGDYAVYQATGTQQSGPGISISNNDSTTIAPGQVRVTGPDGRQVTVFQGSGHETLTQGSTLYTNAVGFHASVVGRYEVRVGAVTPSAILVGPTLGSQLVRSAPWLIFSGVGLLLVILGGILAIVAGTRRGKLKRDAAAAYWAGQPQPAYPGFGYGYGQVAQAPAPCGTPYPQPYPPMPPQYPPAPPQYPPAPVPSPAPAQYPVPPAAPPTAPPALQAEPPASPPAPPAPQAD